MKNESNWDHGLSREAQRKAQAEFRRVLDNAVSPDRVATLGLFTDEEESFIQREVERMLYTPALPSAGDKERLWLEMLKKFAWDETLVVTIKVAAGRYAAAFEKLLPHREYILRPGFENQESDEEYSADEADGIDEAKESKWLRLPGRYYYRCPVTLRTQKTLFDAAIALKQEAGKDYKKLWLAQCLLDGMPEAASNFKIECLYLLRGDDGNVTRLVRLTNTIGEQNEGPEAGQTDILLATDMASAEKFRAWCKSKGNFDWGVGNAAGTLELQMLNADISNASAYRTAKLIKYCGWYNGAGTSKKFSGQVIPDGIWFFDDCAVASDGRMLIPDEDRMIHYRGKIYFLARNGRESEYAHGRPKLVPNNTLDHSEPWLKGVEGVQLVQLDQSDWEIQSKAMPLRAGFFREVCRRFTDTVGGWGGFLSVGTMLGYAAGPEFFEVHGCLPAIFIPGQMGSGKTSLVNWLMGFPGYSPAKGLGLGKGSRVTPVGLCQQLENYSSLPLWFDEFRQHEITDEKASIIRDAYDRQLAGKWAEDGVQRVIRTTPIISGESHTSDAATRSRYTHLQLSAAQRRVNHKDWMRENRGHFVFIWRHVLVNRPDFVKSVMTLVSNWMSAPDTQHIPERSRLTHSLAYAAFVATAALLESHSKEELAEFRQYVIRLASSAAVDVSSDVNVNVFIQDLVTAFKAGAIPVEFFRVTKESLPHPPDRPNQGLWDSYSLYIDVTSVIEALRIQLRKAGRILALGQKDLRDQLSKDASWIEGKINRRFGKKGQRSMATTWGFKVDLHPLGLQKISDETYINALSKNGNQLDNIGPVFEDGDPRKGDLFAIIEEVERYEMGEASAGQ